MSRARLLRSEHQPAVIRDLAWKAQLRLCRRFVACGTPRYKTCVAVAREQTALA
jgi:hypothetical protein